MVEGFHKDFLETKKFANDNQKHLVAYSGHIITNFLKEFYHNKLKFINEYKPLKLNIYSGIIYKNPNPLFSNYISFKKFKNVLEFIDL